MKRVETKRKTKLAMTLVELVVAMALTAIFATACIMLVLPVERIYTRTTDVSRAQILADTIVDSLRTECANTYIDGKGAVWIGSIGNQELTESTTGNSVLVIRKNELYCETIYSNGNVPASALPESGDETSKAIFRLFANANSPDVSEGYVHFGYYELPGTSTNPDSPVLPSKYYDFTNPFSYATYRDYTAVLTFDQLGTNIDGLPSYVVCHISIKNETGTVVYTRDAVLCFAAPVQ